MLLFMVYGLDRAFPRPDGFRLRTPDRSLRGILALYRKESYGAEGTANEWGRQRHPHVETFSFDTDTDFHYDMTFGFYDSTLVNDPAQANVFSLTSPDFVVVATGLVGPPRVPEPSTLMFLAISWMTVATGRNNDRARLT